MSEVLSLYLWRKAVLTRAGDKCERCPATEFLHAHHKDEDRSNNVIENGECLCANCHDNHHERGGSLIAFDAASRRPETRRKIADANRRPATRQKISESQRRHFEEHPEATYSHWQGKKLSAGHKLKIGAAHRGANSAETRRKLSEALKGRVFTEEWKAKLKAAAQAREARKREEVAA